MTSRRLPVSLFLLISCAFSQPVTGFQNEYLDDFSVSHRQLIQLAKAIPVEKYTWRPGKDVRSVGEVYVHIATGNYLLLSLTGVKLPSEHYPQAVAAATNPMVIFKKNLELEKSIASKDAVVRILESSLDAVRDQFAKATAADLERSADFFGEKTTVRRIYLRILAHVSEHMGQSVAYARMNGIAPPWSQPGSSGQ